MSSLLKLPIRFDEKEIFDDLIIIKQNDMFYIWEKYNQIHNYRYDYDLNENSIVFDLGGFKGEWSKNIKTLYKPNIHIFEISEDYFLSLTDIFKNDNKIFLNNFGLSDHNYETELFLNGDKTGIYFNKTNIKEENKDNIKICKMVDFFDYINEHKIYHIDLMKINIEGGEYNLMDYILRSDYIKNIVDIQIQFHNTIDNFLERMIIIQDKLRKTHYQTYCFPTIWENWRIKDDSKIFLR